MFNRIHGLSIQNVNYSICVNILVNVQSPESKSWYIRNGARYITEIVSMNEHEVRIRPGEELLPKTSGSILIVALQDLKFYA